MRIKKRKKNFTFSISNFIIFLICFFFCFLQKMLSQLSQVGDKLKEVGQDIAAKVQEKTAEITKKD